MKYIKKTRSVQQQESKRTKVSGNKKPACKRIGAFYVEASCLW